MQVFVSKRWVHEYVKIAPFLVFEKDPGLDSPVRVHPRYVELQAALRAWSADHK